jgi:spore germination cell wall hydrolase CwlJ-like protein
MKGTLEFVLETARAVMASLAVSYEIETGKAQNIDELKCMAENIYFEGRAEPMIGKIAIGHVVMNRIQDERFPNTICEVVRQGPVRESWKTKKDPTLPDSERKFYPIKNRCQFSWWCDGQKDIIWATYMNGEVITENMTAWRDSIHVALFIMNGDYSMDPTDGAVFYYNPHIANPGWGALYEETAMIGNHRFMKDR